MTQTTQPPQLAKVQIVMGSSSDFDIMKAAADILTEFKIPYDIHVLSAHRSPVKMIEFGKSAVQKGVQVIIAGAGGAAHLPGMLASVTTIPVIGVPVPLKNLSGLDSLLSIVQMPAGIPVATVAIGGAKNAGLLAARILALGNDTIQEELEKYRESLNETAHEQDEWLKQETGKN